MKKSCLVVFLLCCCSIISGLVGGTLVHRAWTTAIYLDTKVSPTGNSVHLMGLVKSPNGIVEATQDTNGDGADDIWEITIRDSQPYTLKYVLEDTNYDGTPDRLGVLDGVGGSHIIFDTDFDQVYDKQLFKLTDTYGYHDFNCDGRLDTMVEFEDGEVSKRYVLIQQQWVRAKSNGEDSGSPEALLLSEDGSDTATLARFENGEWVDAGLVGDDPT